MYYYLLTTKFFCETLQDLVQSVDSSHFFAYTNKCNIPGGLNLRVVSVKSELVTELLK